MKRYQNWRACLLIGLLIVTFLVGCSQNGSSASLSKPVEDAIAQGFAVLENAQASGTDLTDEQIWLLDQGGRLTNEVKADYLIKRQQALIDQPLTKISEMQDAIFAIKACGGNPAQVGESNLIEQVVTYEVDKQQNYVDFYVLVSQLLVAGNLDHDGSLGQAALDKLLATQNGEGAFVDEWGTTIDSTALAVQALALWDEADCAGLTEAKERAVAYLSQQQDKKGYYCFAQKPSLASTAQVCLALVGVGIDPAESPDFQKEEGRLVEALLTLFQDELDKEQEADLFNITQGLMGLVAYHDYLENNPYYYQEAFSNMITQNHDQEQATVHQQKESTQEQSDTNLPPKTSAQEEDKEQALDMTKEPVPAKPQVTIAIVGPEDVGIIMEKTTVDITEGSTVYGVLMQAAKAIKLPVESSGGDKKAYIEGINNIYEQDYGPASGWMYSVDGQFPGTSCGKYKLSGGEDIKFIYTLDMGKDVGAPAE